MESHVSNDTMIEVEIAIKEENIKKEIVEDLNEVCIKEEYGDDYVNIKEENVIKEEYDTADLINSKAQENIIQSKKIKEEYDCNEPNSNTEGDISLKHVSDTHVEHQQTFGKDSKNSHLKVSTDYVIENYFICINANNELNSANNKQTHVTENASNIDKNIDIKLHTRENILQKSQKISHTRTTGEKLFSCDLCHYQSSQRSNLKRHKRKHTGEKPFACDVCDYKTADNSTLMRHKMKHTGERPFVCDLCDYKSSQKSNLIIHRRQHIREKPYSCDMCSYRSSRKSDLILHIRKHTGDKPFACDTCGYRCIKGSDLSRHKKIHRKTPL